MTPEEIFDPDFFVACVQYCTAFFVGGFGLTLAFWLVGYATGRLFGMFGEV